MKTRAISALLWMIRRFGFDLQCEGGYLIYGWIRTPNEGVEHWFASPGVQHNVADVLSTLGFRQLAWQILTESELLVGGERSRYNDVIELKSMMFARHGRLDLLIDNADQVCNLDFLELCHWLTKSIGLFDLADRSRSNRSLRVAAENLRAAAIELVVSLGRRDARIAELLEKEFRSTL
jgi:hypothetical protein